MFVIVGQVIRNYGYLWPMYSSDHRHTHCTISLCAWV